MRPLGFSTGSISPGSVEGALVEMFPLPITAIELSALRTSELAELVHYARDMAWGSFRYASLHLPSRFTDVSEAEVIKYISPLLHHRWPLIVHPDSLSDWDTWQALGQQVCLENMDSRKPAGRTVEELRPIFARLPQAGFCFDIGHAFQVDKTGRLAHELVDAYRDRLKEVHLSVVDDAYQHRPLTEAAMQTFLPVLLKVPVNVAFILETPVKDTTAMRQQLQLVENMQSTSSTLR